MVPNGAKCGANRMCIDTICAPIPEEFCSCNNRGVCNQKSECHCDVGWAPPDCSTKGRGGSLSSAHPATDIDLCLLASQYILTFRYTLDDVECKNKILFNHDTFLYIFQVFEKPSKQIKGNSN